MVPAGSPECLESQLNKMHADLWAVAGPDLTEQIVESVGFSNAEFRETRCKYWPTEYPPLCPNPYKWFRARFLHAQCPADGSIVMKFQSLMFLVTLGFKLWPDTTVAMWLIYFLLIDKSDEYQVK
jgi:hypothetical protein